MVGLRRRVKSSPGRYLFLKIHNFLNLRQKPAVDFGQLKDFFDTEAGAQGVAYEEDALGVGDAEPLGDEFARQDVTVPIDFVAYTPGLAVAAQTVAANLKRTQGLLQRFLERAAYGHGFADAFHLRVEGRIGLREFLEGEPGDFGDDVINGRLETGWSFAGDVVLDFVEQVTHGEFGGDFCDGEPGGLGGQSRARADSFR